MTDHNGETSSGIKRRTILKGAATVGAIGFIGLPAFSGRAVASSHETLYITDTGGDDAGWDGYTKLYEVDLVSENGMYKAELTHLKDITNGNFGQVDAIAATPDGSKIHFVDKNSAHLGEYVVSSGTFSDLGAIAGLSSGDGVVLATYSPGGTLYVAGQNNDELFTVDPSGPAATLVATVTGANVQGADLAFDADGTLYLYSSADGKLYTLDTGTGVATEVGTGQVNKGSFTGLAVRENGTGDLVGSSTSDNTIYVVDKATGAMGTGYKMYSGGEPHQYGYGDMTVGQLCMPCESGETLLVKYEWEDGEFVTEGSDGSIWLTDWDLDEDGEPVRACFETDYCGIDVVVKAGQEYAVSEGMGGAFCVTGIESEKPNGKTVTHAISNIQFFCDVPADYTVGQSE